jgi:hypothetical protein
MNALCAYILAGTTQSTVEIRGLPTKFRNDLLDRPARRCLDDDKVDQHNSKQSWNHQKQTA